MKLYRVQDKSIIEYQQNLYRTDQHWDELINQHDLHVYLLSLIKENNSFEKESWLSTQKIQAPIVSQEIWAAGVTYLRSKVARMEESKVSGGADFYAKVYDAERPELFCRLHHQGNGRFQLVSHSLTWDTHTTATINQ